jgi:hypothetical protein
MNQNLPLAVLTLIKEADSPIDAFTAAVDKLHKYRYKEPIIYRSFAKIAVDLLGRDFILDTYIQKAAEEDMRKAQWCWYKEANQKLTRPELLEFILVEDLPNFVKKASYEIKGVLDNIQGILKESGSIQELAQKSKARMGDELAMSSEILKKKRGEPSVLGPTGIPKKANRALGYANAGRMSLPSSASGLGGSGGMGMGRSMSMRAGSTMPSLGGMRSSMGMKPIGRNSAGGGMSNAGTSRMGY